MLLHPPAQHTSAQGDSPADRAETTRRRRPALVRTAVVATTSAAAALFTLLPATGGETPAPGTTTAAAPAAADIAVRPVAFTAPAAATQGALEGSAPAAMRASAVQNALGKLGAPYIWGASGPSAFDCSGLTSWAFKQAGVSLPRTASAQATVGTPVSKADLQPGDLVFFYQPISHVAIYLGNGQVVHASTSGQPVKISPLSSMPFSGARRV